MKLSKKTVDVLSCFSGLSNSILIREGNVLRVRNASRDASAKAVIEESFPKEFLIYDIGNFLRVVKLFQEPEIDFEDTHMVLHGGNASVRYMYSNPDLYTTAPENVDFVPQNVLWSMGTKLENNELHNIQKASTVMNLDVVSFSRDGIRIYNNKSPDANHLNLTYNTDISLDGSVPDNFNVNIASVRLALYEGNYDINIDVFKYKDSRGAFQDVGAMKLENKEDAITYWLASLPNSKL